jgi:hypothetical protein
MSKIHSRRAVLAGIATPLAAPALALSGTGPDPIYAAIAAHDRVLPRALKGELPE